MRGFAADFIPQSFSFFDLKYKLNEKSFSKLQQIGFGCRVLVRKRKILSILPMLNLAFVLMTGKLSIEVKELVRQEEDSIGYEIKLTELQSLRSAAMASCSEWQQQLQALQMGFMGLGTAIGMQGRTADSICCYVDEVHGTIIRNLLQMMTEYVTKIAVYEQGYMGIDSRSDAHITQDVLEDKMTEFLSKQSEFEELSESIRSVLDEVSDICWISSPPSGAIESHFGEVQSQLSQQNEKVGTYENEHRADCDSIKEYLQTIRLFISGQSGKGQVILSTYAPGTIQQNPLHQRLDELHGSSSEYIGTNYEELQAVSDRMQAEIDAEIAKAVEERKTQGIIGIVNGVIMAGGSIVGGGAIILSGGAATPVVAGLLSVGASTTILYGASDIYERGDTYRLADAGDLTSIARNPIRDSVFNGNQMVYDTWGTIGSLAFLAGGMMQTAATISSQGTVQVENLTERTNMLSGVGGKYSVFGEMTTGEIAPWFGRDGGGEQFVKYKTNGCKYTIKELEKEGILEDITDLVEKGEIQID